jgi:hypothetical protein
MQAILRSAKSSESKQTTKLHLRITIPLTILGNPTLILLHFALMAALLAFGRKRLPELNRDYNVSFHGLK